MLTRLAKILDVLAVYLEEGPQSNFARHYSSRFYRFLTNGSLYQPPLLSEPAQKEHSDYWTRFHAVLQANSDPGHTQLILQQLPPLTHADVAIRALHTGFIYRKDTPSMIRNAIALTKLTHYDPKSCMDSIAAALLTSFVYNDKNPNTFIPDLISFFQENQNVPFSQEEVDAYLMPWISYQEWEYNDHDLTHIDPESRWARLKEYLDPDSERLGDGSTDVLLAALDTILTPLRFEPFFHYNVLSWGNNQTITLIASIWYEKLYPDALLDLPKVWTNYG